MHLNIFKFNHLYITNTIYRIRRTIKENIEKPKQNINNVINY